MRHDHFRLPALLLSLALTAAAALPAARAAEGDRTYTVTANLFCPGELNTQLPGVTAYMTNGANPLGLDGYEATAPATPVADNATLTVGADDSLTVTVPIPNPVFTLQTIGGCSNAEIVAAPRDDRDYNNMDGTPGRKGRITSLTVRLNDASGKYVFTSCKEYPTLLSCEWTVPLTLAVDLSAAELGGEAAQPAESQAPALPPVNTDGLKALTATVDKLLAETTVSADGSEVEPSRVWVTRADADALRAENGKAAAALAAADQTTVDGAADRLEQARKAFLAATRSGKKVTELPEPDAGGVTLAEGSYTVSCNVWFNKADTTLPLNPHITNPTFPPYNPVLDNAVLTVYADGSAKVTVPVTIQDKIMSVKTLTGLDFTDLKYNEAGGITEFAVELGVLPTDSTVITLGCHADIEMGDLAMSISGLDKPHSWPATFELNLSGIPRTDGTAMPVVEVEMMDSTAASDALAGVTGGGELPGESPEPVESAAPEADEADSGSGGAVAVVIVAVAAVAVIAFVVSKRKR